jgi:peptidoglycan hydrolase-like protein with peptidoglycan-binding domain
MDPPVQFVCGSVGQTDPEPERSAIAEEAANCYLNPSSIRQAQQHLKSLGLYKSTIDGVSGRGTKAAIKKAKKLVGRKASAGDCITAKDITEFGLLAEAAVVAEELKTNTDEDDASETEGPIPEASNYQLSETQRLDAQRALKKFGFYNGMIDGDIGPATKIAVKSWQEATGYSATGELTEDQIDQLLLDEEVLPDILKPESGQSITSVVVQITKPTFDVYSCAFHLEFTNSASGKSFDVVMYAEGSDGKFTASTKDIQTALANSGLTAEDNNLKALSIKAKKYDDPNVVCKPTNQNSYLITEDGTEGTFKIDSDGQLTMTGLPIVTIN